MWSAVINGAMVVAGKLFSGGSGKPPSDDAQRNAYYKQQTIDVINYGIGQLTDLPYDETNAYGGAYKTYLQGQLDRYSSLPVYTPAEAAEALNSVNTIINGYNTYVQKKYAGAISSSSTVSSNSTIPSTSGASIIDNLFGNAAATLSNFMDLWSKKEITSINEDATNAAIEATTKTTTTAKSTNWLLIGALIIGLIFLIRRLK